MLIGAIELFQLGRIGEANAILSELNKNKGNVTFLSLHLQAVCLAKLSQFDKAKGLALEALDRATQTSQKMEVKALIENIEKALTKQSISLPHLEKLPNIGEQVTASNKSLFTLIVDFVELLEKMGARFSSELFFIEKNGVLSIEYRGSEDSQASMILPLSCMPMLSDFQFCIRDGELDVDKLNEKQLNPAAAPVLEHMLKLFKQTGKLKGWSESFAFVVLKDNIKPFELIEQFRPFTGKIASYYELTKTKQNEALLINSFLGSREFNYTKEHFAGSNVHFSQNSEKGLLAIIDFLNHKMGKNSYQIDINSNVMFIPAKQSETELFVQYGVFDPLQTLLIYGFVDQQTPFIYSGLFELELPSGELLCNLAYSGKAKRAGSLPKALLHLHEILPAGIQKQGNKVGVTDIIIPDASEKSLLFEVVEHILVTANPMRYQNTASLKADTEKVLVSIIQVNLAFWQRFQQQVTELLSPELAKKSQLLSLSQVYIDKLTQFEIHTEQ